MDNCTVLRKRIIYYLEERNLSIHKLAGLSGICPTTVRNILYDKTKNPRLTTIKNICDGLEISLKEFFDT